MLFRRKSKQISKIFEKSGNSSFSNSELLTFGIKLLIVFICFLLQTGDNTYSPSKIDFSSFDPLISELQQRGLLTERFISFCHFFLAWSMKLTDF